jgi:hypothetical protein
MKTIKMTVGISDRYNRGKVVFIDFTYSDWIVVWIEYKTKCVGYLAR